MFRMRAAVLIVSAALIATVAVVALMAASGSDDPVSVQAAGKPTLTPTPGPPPTPKPENDGYLGGLYKIQVSPADPARSEDGAGADTCGDGIDNGGDNATDSEDPDCLDKSISLFHCIAKVDHDATEEPTDPVKVKTQCYVDNVGLDDPTDIMPTLPGEGPDMAPGPPPPPPYTSGVPAQGNGTLIKDVEPGKDLLQIHVAFPVNGPDGNYIAVVEFHDPLGQEAANDGKAGGTLELYLGQSDEWLELKEPSGDPDLVLPIQWEFVEGKDVPEELQKDNDGDGCSDQQELAKYPDKCGDDPYNPYDGPDYTDDMSGSYSMTAEVLEADYDKVLDEPIPGAYYQCLSDMQEDPDNILNARIFCYIDIPGVPVNPEAGPESGDGLSGGMPPKPYADVSSTQQTWLTGYVDPVKNTIEMWGCFWDDDGTGALGNVIVRTHWLDLHTLQGHVWIWVLQDKADCHAMMDTGEWVEPSDEPVLAELSMVRHQLKGVLERDTDADGCPNKDELGDDPSDGGLRDPYNHWDYFNPTNDGLNRVDDILKVVGQYFCDNGTCPEYTQTTDRTAVIGANPWNLNQPNGQQRVDDILAAVKSYFHDCSGGTKISDDDAQFDYVKLK